jgi:hypothetical protein
VCGIDLTEYGSHAIYGREVESEMRSKSPIQMNKFDYGQIQFEITFTKYFGELLNFGESSLTRYYHQNFIDIYRNSSATLLEEVQIDFLKGFIPMDHRITLE